RPRRLSRWRNSAIPLRYLRSAGGTRTRITARTLSAERGLTSRERLHSKLSEARGRRLVAGPPAPALCSTVEEVTRGASFKLQTLAGSAAGATSITLSSV